MANQNLLIVNATDTAYSNVNAAGDDIPAYSLGKDGAGTVTVLTDAEQATFAAAHTDAVILICPDTTEGTTAPRAELRALAAKILELGRNPGSSTREQ